MDNLWLGGIIKSMKSAFSMIVYYLVATVVGCIAFASIYMVCCDLTLLVAGETLNFFEFSFFVKGLITVFPLVVSISLGLIVLYGLRHRENHFFRLVTYVLLGALTWLILIPFNFNLEKKYGERFDKNFEVSFLSPGFFRREAGGVFYFSKVDEQGLADGLFVDLTGITGAQGSVMRFEKSPIDEDFSGIFADSLVRDAVKLPFVIVAPLEVYSTIVLKAKEAWARGYGYWLGFLTFALALLSVLALQYVSKWRLVNALLILFSAGLILVLNYAYYRGFILFNLSKSWAAYFSSIAMGKTGVLQNLFEYEDPLLAIINLSIFVILLIAGIFLYIFNGRKIGGEE